MCLTVHHISDILFIMALKISELRTHLKELREQELKLKAQIQHTDGLISAMSRQPSQKGDTDDESVPFEAEISSFFKENENTPTKRATIIKAIMAKYPMLTKDNARNKFVHLSRSGVVIKTEKKYLLAKPDNPSP